MRGTLTGLIVCMLTLIYVPAEVVSLVGTTTKRDASHNLRPYSKRPSQTYGVITIYSRKIISPMV